MSDQPYTKEELRNAALGFPRRGVLCPKCKTRIPRFVDLHELAEARIRKLIRENNKPSAIDALQAITGCPQHWAKIWVIHSGKPASALTGPPCPYCHKLLRTVSSKQCPHCLMDWHDPRKPVNLCCKN